jgi:hypothetical protein
MAPYTRSITTSASMAVLVFVVGYGSDLILVRHAAWMWVDDVLLAIVVGLVIFYYEENRAAFLAERLRIIRDMNRFIRNELQIATASLDSQDHPPQVNEIEKCLDHIDWALREILPGKIIPFRDHSVSRAAEGEPVNRSA